MIFAYAPYIRRPRYGGPRRNFAIPFGTDKLEWWGYPTVKNFEDMYNRSDRIPACEGQTDRQMDGRTNEQTSFHGIVRAMHTRRAVESSSFIAHGVCSTYAYFSTASTQRRCQ